MATAPGRAKTRVMVIHRRRERRSEGVEMAVENALAGVAVGDLEAAKRWYAQVVGRPADLMPTESNELAEWHFELGGALQLFVDKGRAGHSSATLVVPKLDAEIESVRAAGIHVGRMTDTPFVRTAILSDPDGNRVVLAQSLASTLLS
jgi:predicted enzyme related to lactoylglutathione lyase